MKILVIGGGDFLGSYAIEQLIKEDSAKEIINYDIAVEGFIKNSISAINNTYKKLHYYITSYITTLKIYYIWKDTKWNSMA